MDPYRIEWKTSALRELKRLDRGAMRRIVAAVEALSLNPFPRGFVKLYAGEHTYRMRVGTYRVIYEVFTGHLIVEIIRVRHRKDAYRG